MDLNKLSDEELDAMLAQKMAQPQRIDYSKLTDEELDAMAFDKLAGSQVPDRSGEAALAGFGQAATLGYLPQLQAAASQGIDAITQFIPGSPANVDRALEAQGFTVQQPTYISERDAFARQAQELQQQNPVAYGAGQVAGALTSGVATGGAGGAASLVGKVGQAAKTGGLMGLLQNPGEIEGELDPLQLQERLKNAAIGAVSGAVVQGSISGASSVAQKLKEIPTNLKRFSELKALKASGAMLRDFRKAYGNNKASELGREVLDSGIVSAGDDVADIAKKAIIAKQAAGEAIGDIYALTDDAIMKLDPSKLDKKDLELLSKSTIDLEAFANGYKKQLRNKLRGNAGGSEIYNKVASYVDEIAQNGKDVPLQRLREVRSSIDDLINFSKANAELSGVQKEYLALRNKIQDLAKERVNVVDRIRGTKNLESLNTLNKKFSNLAEITKIAQDKAAREQSNAAFGLRERISGGAGAVVGGMIGGPAGAIAGGVLGSITTKAARQYGTPLVARIADRTARVLEKNPALLGEFAEPLLRAAQENPKTFVDIVARLRVDPDFKRKINEGSK